MDAHFRSRNESTIQQHPATSKDPWWANTPFQHEACGHLWRQRAGSRDCHDAALYCLLPEGIETQQSQPGRGRAVEGYVRVLRSTTYSHAYNIHMAMDQYLYIPFLGGWTSIYQLFWCELQGYKVLTHSQNNQHAYHGWSRSSNFTASVVIPLTLLLFCWKRDLYQSDPNFCGL